MSEKEKFEKTSEEKTLSEAIEVNVDKKSSKSDSKKIEFEAAIEDENINFLENELSEIDSEEALKEAGGGDSEVLESELGEYESAEIEEKDFIDDQRMYSIIESMLFSTDRPLSAEAMKQAFKGTNINIKKIRKAIEEYSEILASADRGVFVEKVGGGYQLRTKQDNVDFLQRTQKGRPFRLSGPALEVLSIIAYEQPCIKARVDEIRAVESGHLMRALMDKGLVAFDGKSELPGKPMLYKTTKKFLEIFSLRSLKELPSLDEIEQLIPEGIGDEEEDTKLEDITDGMSLNVGESYSEGEEELMKITDQLSDIDTSTDFFEQEKKREKEKRDKERAEDIEMALEDGADVEKKDIKWLERYKAKIEEAKTESVAVESGESVIQENVASEQPQTSEEKVTKGISEAAKALDAFAED